MQQRDCSETPGAFCRQVAAASLRRRRRQNSLIAPQLPPNDQNMRDLHQWVFSPPTLFILFTVLSPLPAGFLAQSICRVFIKKKKRKKKGQHQVAVNEVEAAMIHCFERWEFFHRGAQRPDRLPPICCHMSGFLINPAAPLSLPRPTDRMERFTFLIWNRLERGQALRRRWIGPLRNQAAEKCEPSNTKGVGGVVRHWQNKAADRSWSSA